MRHCRLPGVFFYVVGYSLVFHPRWWIVIHPRLAGIGRFGRYHGGVFINPPFFQFIQPLQGQKRHRHFYSRGGIVNTALGQR